jgi:hypothetical protein
MRCVKHRQRRFCTRSRGHFSSQIANYFWGEPDTVSARRGDIEWRAERHISDKYSLGPRATLQIDSLFLPFPSLPDHSLLSILSIRSPLYHSILLMIPRASSERPEEWRGKLDRISYGIPNAPLTSPFSPEILHRHDTTSNRDIEHSFHVMHLHWTLHLFMPGSNLDIIGWEGYYGWIRISHTWAFVE